MDPVKRIRGKRSSLAKSRPERWKEEKTNFYSMRFEPDGRNDIFEAWICQLNVWGWGFLYNCYLKRQYCIYYFSDAGSNVSLMTMIFFLSLSDAIFQQLSGRRDSL